MNQYDVTALGELLIDFTQNGYSVQENPMFEANPGGAPCNVLAMLQKLGHSTAFIGKIGNDVFGKQLKKALVEVGIATEGLCYDKKVHTTLAIVQTEENGERDFSFYRDPGADVMLSKTDLNEELIKNSKIFHFGSLSMTQEPARSATKRAIEIAEQSGLLISFDPNLRTPLWESLDEAKKQIHYGLEHCQILKISDNEISWFTGEPNYEKAVKKLKDMYPIKLILVSLGIEGSMAYYNNEIVYAKPFIHPDTIETTGAGDTFMGCVLHKVLEIGINHFQYEDLEEMLQFSNAAASLITRKKGALRVMPELTEIVNCRRNKDNETINKFANFMN